MNRFVTTLIVLLSLLAGACQSGGETSAGETSVDGVDADESLSWPSGPSDVVLQIDEPINQPDPFAVAGAYPPFTLYGDGRVIYRDRSIEAGALAPLMQARISPAGVAHLLAEAFDADVFGSPDTSRDTTLSDPPVTIIRADINETQVDFSIGDNRELHAFADRLETDWSEIVGGEVIEPPARFDFDTVLVLGSQRRQSTAVDATVPLPVDLAQAPEYRTRIIPITCVELSAPDFAPIAPAVEAITTRVGATWESGGESWYVAFRQLLPHEPGCDLIPDQ